jgi:tRNA A-37 threonylcarbamoyl transferase component Bud32
VAEPAHSAPAFEPLSLVGTTFDGRYELVAHLATGGMGAVFRARHVHLRKDVAVKVLRPDLTSSAEIVERFRREAEIASALEHDNIVRVTDFGRTPDGYLFLAMELLAGESLFDRLRREGSLAPEEAVPILWQVCAGLEAAHALGVVHRDLKPENVFLARTPSGREVTKVLDFGIAKIADPSSESSTQAGIVVGTPEYLSPEQAMGTAIDARADVYAVGLIAWRTLAGRHPFKADDARGLLMMQATRPVPPLTDPRPDLAAYPALVAAVAKACAKDPAARHQTAAALGDDLAAAIGPAFMMPRGATPAPSISLSPIPLDRSARDAGAARAVPGATLEVAPPHAVSPTVARALAIARARLAILRAVRGARDRAAELASDAVGLVRRHPALAIIVATACLVAGITLSVRSWQRGRAPAEVRALLAANRPQQARAVADAALADRPDDPELLLLRGRALHRIPGGVGEGIDAYALARKAGPLDAGAYDDLVAALGRERALADRAAHVLLEEGPPALPAILRAAGAASGLHRLRALALARDLGAEDRVDRAQAYGELLGDADCDIRRAAARRLGEIGDPSALPRLRRAAQAKTETKGFLGRTKSAPACGAPEADAAARRIEASRPH